MDCCCEIIGKGGALEYRKWSKVVFMLRSLNLLNNTLSITKDFSCIFPNKEFKDLSRGVQNRKDLSIHPCLSTFNMYNDQQL